jgi:uncharacterized protein (TIGR03382 family)
MARGNSAQDRHKRLTSRVPRPARGYTGWMVRSPVGPVGVAAVVVLVLWLWRRRR